MRSVHRSLVACFAVAASTAAGLGCAAGTDSSAGDGSPGGPDGFGGFDTGGTPDTGAPDVFRFPDVGTTSDGGVDRAASDSSGADTISPPDAATDTTPPDSGPPDAPPPDTSDASMPDAPPDAGAPDTSSPDVTAPDGGPTDSGGTDAGHHDAAPDSSVTCIISGFTGTLATFDLVGEPGDEASASVTSTGGGVTSSALSRASTITPVTGTDSINGSGWGMGTSADSTRYYTFTLAPGAGCTLTLSSIALDVRASSTGPTAGDVATGADAFKTHSASFAGTSVGTTTLAATNAGAIEVRVYGYGASASAGTFRIRNTMTVSGSIL